MNSNQQVIIELKSGTKCEGVLVSIDKEKMLIKLSNAKRISHGEDGKAIEESFPQLEIAKDEIKEVKIVQFEPSASQEAKKSESAQSTNLNAIPQNLQNNTLSSQQNQGKTYNKTDSFFDALTPMTNQDAQYESIRYNDKNCETFDLPPGSMNDNSSSYRGRGRGRGGNRGGYRGGYNNYRNNNSLHYPHNNSHYHNPNNNFYNKNNQGGMGYSNSNPYNNNFDGFSQGQNSNYRGGRGGYRGGYNNNNNYRNNNNNYHNNYQNHHIPHFNNSNSNYTKNFPNSDNQSNYSNQFQKQAQMFGANNNDVNNNNPIPNFEMSGETLQPNFNNANSGNFGNFLRGRGGQSRGFSGGNNGFSGNNYRGGRGGNRHNNMSNRNAIPNPEFNSINESGDVHEQLDDDYCMSIYDKPSSSEAFASQKQNNHELSAYDPNAGKN